jgi:hypothetical protein
MRYLLVLLVLLLLGWQWLDKPEPAPVEESFIAAPVGRLQEAEAFEERYLEQDEARKKRMEEALEGDGG